MRPGYVSLALIILRSPLSAQEAQLEENPASVSIDALRTHVFNLADDSMMGRVLGEIGYLKAARYVAEQLRNIHVGPAFQQTDGAASEYFHGFEVELPRLSPRPFESFNVVGIAAGTDPAKRGQVIVVGAHLDHVGWPDPSSIYNGASDNGSGVAVVLEVARLIALHPPSRTVLFTFFGAEEVGLVGSAEFVKLMASDVTALSMMVNVDDVGHLDADAIGRPLVTVLPGKFDCVAMMDQVRLAGDSIGVGVSDVDRNDVFERSDHYSFFKAGIPVLFVTAGGFYDQYHEPSDDPDTLDYASLGKVAEVVYSAVHAIAENTPECAFLGI